ncbi:MAG: cobyrinate a,c-diamide synthase [bacterium]
MSSFYISATHKSSGKTTLSIGLCAALSRKGLVVQAFKKGPDYIDPMWLTLASNHKSYNLDFYTQTPDEIFSMFRAKGQGSEIQLIEGNKGLFDGLDLEGSNSNAALAKLLEVPVVLVLNTEGTIRGVAPLLLGYQAFDPAVNIGGVILNKVGGSRHESKLRAVIERYTDLEVFGAVPRTGDIELIERHLGLIPSNEEGEAAAKVFAMADQVEQSVDLDKLIGLDKSIAWDASSRYPQTKLPHDKAADTRDITIGVVKDAAFGFYYNDDLEALEDHGANLQFINAIEDSALPENLDGLFIGGGFPESFLSALSSNSTMIDSISSAIESGLPTYAECGGLMYLSEAIESDEGTFPMVGAIQGKAVMSKKPKGRGYTELEVLPGFLWGGEGEAVFAHEFHYSSLVQAAGGEEDFGFKVLRGEGVTGSLDGVIKNNLVANYTHLRHTSGYPWCKYFTDFVRSLKGERHLRRV